MGFQLEVAGSCLSQGWSVAVTLLRGGSPPNWSSSRVGGEKWVQFSGSFFFSLLILFILGCSTSSLLCRLFCSCGPWGHC